jgi:iron complex transport system ATP-binding protein
LAARRLDELSGGERQRAVLARAIAQEAPILLLDEPTTALDVGRQQEVLELVAELRAERGFVVLAAMHDLTLAGQYAESLVLLDAGRVAAEGPASEVLTEELIARHYRARVRVERIGETPVVLPAPREVAAR